MKLSSYATAWWLALIAAWVWTWRHLSGEWSVNPQYQYGYGIPFLWSYMIWARWRGRFHPSQRLGTVGMLAAGTGVLILFFGELLRRQDPLWRLTGLQLVLGSTLLTLTFFWRQGGWPLLRRQLFPLAFAWLALPWPTPLESVTTHFLLTLVTGATVIVTNFMGIAALQHGAVVELRNAYIGIESACSGIESFQATLVVTLFLGEFFSLSARNRFVAVMGGWGICLAGNFCRIETLILLAHFHGHLAAQEGHDAVGTAATVLTFSGVFLWTWFLARPAVVPSQPAADATTPVIPGREGIAVLLAVLLIPVLATGWFSQSRIHSSNTPPSASWMPDSHKPGPWKITSLPEPAGLRTALRFTDWSGLALSRPEEGNARLVYFYWKPDRAAPRMAFPHNPDVCMPGSGWSLTGEPFALVLRIHGQPVPFRAYRFRQDGFEPLAVLQALKENGVATTLADPDQATRLNRLALLWRAPLEQINEELLLYLPDQSGADLAENAQAVLNAVF